MLQLLKSIPFYMLALCCSGCGPSGTPAGVSGRAVRDPIDRAEPVAENARTEALLALDAAEAARRGVAAGSDTNTEMVKRGDDAFDDAEVARFNSRFRAARELYMQASEFYLLAVEVSSASVGTRRSADSGSASREIEIPTMQPVAGASEQTVAALFADVDRVQRLAYTGGGLQAAGALIGQADAELWDAQIAYQRGEFEPAAGHLRRIHAMYSEAYRRARRVSDGASISRDDDRDGPIRWADSLNVAKASARESGKPVMLLLYEQASYLMVSLFADSQVRRRAREVVPCKHRVTDILAGVDDAFLSASDREVSALIDAFALRSFPAILLLSAKGEYLDFRSAIAGRTTILELLEEVE